MKTTLLKDDASIFKYIGVWLLCGLVAYLLSIPVGFLFSSPSPTAAEYWMSSIVSIALAGMSTIAIYSVFESLNKKKVILWIIISNLIASLLAYISLKEIDSIHAILTILSLQIFSLFFYFTFNKDNERFEISIQSPQTQAAESEIPNSSEIIFHPKFRDPTKENWAEAYSEYESDKRDLGIYARLYSEFNGDEAKIKAAYLKERAVQLQDRSSLNAKRENLQKLVTEANIFMIKDGFVVGIKNPLLFLCFKKEELILVAYSIDDLETKCISFKTRELLTKEQKEEFLKKNIEFIISESKRLDI